MNRRLLLITATCALLALCHLGHTDTGSAPGTDEPNELTFVQLSDLHCAHVDENPEPAFPFDPHVKDLVRSFEWLRAAVDDINEHVKPDFVTITGDIADRASDLRSLRRAARILERLDCPFYPVVGDHGSARSFRRVFGRSPNYTFTTPGWRFIVLDCHTGTVDQDGLDLLKRSMRGASADVRTVMLLHRPLSVPPIARKLARTFYGSNLRLQAGNGDKVMELAKQNPSMRAVLAGHIHMTTERKLDGLRQFTTGSLVEDPHTYRVFRVKDGRLTAKRRTLTLNHACPKSSTTPDIRR